MKYLTPAVGGFVEINPVDKSYHKREHATNVKLHLCMLFIKYWNIGRKATYPQVACG
ncbi:MAG TPA: hypothetical protein VFC27_02705 [Anaerovoracaceae bacterium]|nr:hypothetical protein [Anaerovoracaceae bacterium]